MEDGAEDEWIVFIATEFILHANNSENQMSITNIHVLYASFLVTNVSKSCRTRDRDPKRRLDIRAKIGVVYEQNGSASVWQRSKIHGEVIQHPMFWSGVEWEKWE